MIAAYAVTSAAGLDGRKGECRHSGALPDVRRPERRGAGHWVGGARSPSKALAGVCLV